MAPLRPFLCRTGIISHHWPDTAHSLLRRLRRNGRGEPQGSHCEYLWSKPAQHRQQDSQELSEWWHRRWAQLPDGSRLGGRVETDARKLGQRTGEAQHKASREGYGYLCDVWGCCVPACKPGSVQVLKGPGLQGQKQPLPHAYMCPQQLLVQKTPALSNP